MQTRDVDVIVIGAGPVGEVLAGRTAAAGLETLIVEDELVGGECSYWACMPSKALLRPGAALRQARSVTGVDGGMLVPRDVLRRRDEFASEWDDSGQVSWLDDARVELARGRGRIAGERLVRVEDAELRARHAVVIATGSDTALPDIEGLVEARPWTSREVTAMCEVPDSVAIIGGGAVAVESATLLSDLGSRVSLLSHSPLLGRMERFAGEAVRDGLAGRGVEVREDADPVRIARDVDGVTISLADGTAVVADEIVVAAGRMPNTADLGLGEVGLEDGSFIEVDDTMRANGSDWLYAAGDVAGRALLTHQGKYEARAAADAIIARAKGEEIEEVPWGRHVATADARAVPQIVFADPEVAAVGLTLREAEDKRIRARAVDVDLGSVAGATLTADDYAGTVRAVVDQERRVLVGMTLAGPGVGELLHAATIAITGEVPLDRLRHAVPAYPAISEFWLQILEECGL